MASVYAPVAEWMLQQIEETGSLSQEYAVGHFSRRSGNALVYTNAGGRMAIKKVVLDEFVKLTGDDVVWSKGKRLWRKRQADDFPGRQQD
jgi:hypothetical protein